MTLEAPAILVVANPDDGRRISGLLTTAGIGGLLWGDGGDDTLTLYEELEPRVVVLCAGLDRGDARALATAIRGGSRGGQVKIVLVGERNGPVRNALDAHDYAVDRFVGHPVSPKALAFAVRSCLTAAQDHRSDSLRLVPAVPVPVPPDTTDRTEFDDDALAAAAVDLTDDAEEDTPEPAAVVADQAEELMHPDFTSESSYPEVSIVDRGNDGRDDVEVAGAPDDLDADVPEREPTLVLSDGGASLPPHMDISSPAIDVADGADPEPPAAQGGVRGAFARELRRKMSLMAERLFPNQAAARLDVGVAHDPHTEIDLTSIGSEPVTGITHEVGPYAEIGDADTFAETDPRAAAAALARPATPPPSTGERTLERTGERFVDRTGDRPGSREGERVAEGSDSDAGTGTTRRRRATAVGRGAIDTTDNDVATLIARFYRDRFTGQVRFRRDDIDKSVHFDDGRPAFATSNRPHDRMGELLFREGKITREQHARSRELVAESGRRMGEILVDLGFIKRRELLPAVRRHVEDVIYSLFAWRAGEYEATAGDCAPGEKIRLSRHPAAIVVEGIRRKYDLEVLVQRIGSGSAVVTPRSREAVQAVVADIDLAPAERQVVDLIDGERTLADVAAAAAGDVLGTYHMAFALVALGAADAQRGPITAVPRDEPARAPSLVGATDLAIDRQRVLAKFSLVNEADYFLLLGVRRDASGFEIRRAYEAARRDYAPESFPVEIRRELAGQIDLINRMLEEAFQVLRADRVRAAYLSNLRD